MSKPFTRDYKHTRRQGLDVARWREFALGLGVGLVVALGLFVYQRNALQHALADAASARPEPRRVTSVADASAPESPDGLRDAGGGGGDAVGGEGGAQYDFYEMLPKFEVVVPEREREVKRDTPNAPIERPGVYVLQAGSYRKLEDAERVKKKLAVQGIDAAVQRVAVDADVWHRVRVGPLDNLGELNRIRGRLRSADLDALVIRVGD